MVCRPVPLVALATVLVALSTGVGACTSALWLFSAEKLPLACAVLAFALLVAPSELLGGSAIAVRLARRSSYGSIVLWLCVWVIGALAAVCVATVVVPDLGATLSLGLVATSLGGLSMAIRQRAAFAIAKATIPWASGALPLWLGASLPALSPAALVVQGLLLVASVLLPVVLSAALLGWPSVRSFTLPRSVARIGCADRASALSLPNPWSTRAMDPRVSAVGLSGIRGGYPHRR